MKNRTKLILIFAAGAITGAAIITGFAFRKPEPKETTVEVKNDGKLEYKWYAPDIPKSMDFCGEKVPLNRWEVRERLDRDMIVNYYAHGGTLYMLKNVTRYFPVIEARLKANGVPDDFKYVCAAESSLQPTATSSVGAASLWQFMKDTAPRYGLEINENVDERYNVVKATDAACAFFNEAHRKFGSWTAAAASYNCGQGGYASQVSFQGGNSFYDMVFPEETNRYIFRILSLKAILSQPKAWGFMLDASEGYQPVKTRNVTVTATVENLADFARQNGTSYKMLKLQNPWLRSRTLPVRPGKSYVVEIPVD
ncbi:MAG: lytic transglycosylase domain-containing protein [Bacteroidetes bacterium]|nr:lytic transglycosylase domain-containing protein [Bacteroidota bacterium]